MSRLVVMLLLIGDIFVFFMMQSQFDENGRWALVGSALILAIIWVFLGDTPEPQKVARRQVQTAKKPETSSDVEVDIPDVIKEDEMDGPSETYYENGQLKVKGSTRNGKPDGLFMTYYENGQLGGKGYFTNGKQEGLSVYYYENGKLMEKENYKSNQKHAQASTIKHKPASKQAGKRAKKQASTITLKAFDVQQNFFAGLWNPMRPGV